jgi:hypothetical protein
MYFQGPQNFTNVPLLALNAAGPGFLNEAATATNPTLVPNRADLDTGIGWGTTNELTLVTAGAERVRVDASGNLGIGGNQFGLFNAVGGSTKLAVVGESATTAVIGNTDASISIINKDGTALNTAGLHFARADTDETPNYAGASIVAQFSATQVTGQYPAADLNFCTSTSQNSAPSLKMTLTAAGYLGIGTASPAAALDVTNGEFRMTDGRNMQWGGANCRIQGTNAGAFQIFAGGAEQVRVDTDGLKFNGDTAAANALDDYEEGTWTPTFVSTSATFAYTTQGGTYTKVGRTVTASFRLQLSGAPGGTTSNTCSVAGLPFATGTLEQTYHGGIFGHYFGFNLSTTGVLAYQLSSGASTTELKVVGDNLGETAVLASHLNSTAQIRGCIIYQTA